MSEILVNKLTGKTTANDITVTVGASATMSLEQGLCKTWIKYTDHDSALASADSFNVSSISDTDTGKVTVNFTNNMSSIDFCFLANAHDMASRAFAIAGYIPDETSTNIATSKLVVWTGYVNNTNGGLARSDSDIAMVTIHGDLA